MPRQIVVPQPGMSHSGFAAGISGGHFSWAMRNVGGKLNPSSLQ
jgi:hypothetical protein